MKHKGRTPLIDDNKIVIIFHECKGMGPFLSLSLAVAIYKSWIITYVTSVPLKKVVCCIFIDSLCLYYEFDGKFLFHITSSSCQML